MWKRIILFILCCVCINCYAEEWASVGKGYLRSIFIEKNSIKEVGEYRQAWVLYSYDERRTTPSNIRYFSEVSLEKFDCTKKMASPVKTIFYKDRMAGGGFVGTMNFRQDNFKPVAPKTIREAKLNYVCSYEIQE